MKKGKLILINGASSVGKTSLCRAFQDNMDDMWVRLGIDHFWFIMPPNKLVLTPQQDAEYFILNKHIDKDGYQYDEFLPGPKANKVVKAGFHSLSAYLDIGINIISDQIFWSWDWVCSAMEKLENYHVLMIKLVVEDNVGIQRESLRGEGINEEDAERNNRPNGHYLGSAKVVHQGIIYDYFLDFTCKMAEELAVEIERAFISIKKPTALNKMRKKYYQKETKSWLNPRISQLGEPT